MPSVFQIMEVTSVNLMGMATQAMKARVTAPPTFALNLG
jgi:hypothetical protein